MPRRFYQQRGRGGTLSLLCVSTSPDLLPKDARRKSTFVLARNRKKQHTHTHKKHAIFSLSFFSIIFSTQRLEQNHSSERLVTKAPTFQALQALRARGPEASPRLVMKAWRFSHMTKTLQNKGYLWRFMGNSLETPSIFPWNSASVGLKR